MNHQWSYNGRSITELPAEVAGFVYIIYYTDGTRYVGKKTIRSEVRGKPLVGMRSNAKRLVEKVHKWKDYEGSSEATKDLKIQSKVILHLSTNKMTTTWLEVKEMVERNVILDKSYHNKNILGKFYDNCEDGVYHMHFKQPGLFDDHES